MNNSLNTVYLHKTSSPKLIINQHDYSEVYRYAGINHFDNLCENEKKTFSCMAENTINELLLVCKPICAYIKVNINNSNQKNTISFLDKNILSKDLAKNLLNCSQTYLFCATLGLEVDKLIIKNSKINQLKAIFLHATGAMLIEKYCDLFQTEIANYEKSHSNTIKPRFSPGYGDLSLETQTIFFELLQCTKKLNLKLNDNLLMIPEKSVTAFIGVKNETNQ